MRACFCANYSLWFLLTAAGNPDYFVSNGKSTAAFFLLYNSTSHS